MDVIKKIEINNYEQSYLTETTTANSNYINNSSNLDLAQNSIVIENKEIAPEIKEQIERMVDAHFEETYKNINVEYDAKIEELLNEQEDICNKNEIIKAKYEALEEYLKDYCKRMNIDYASLIQDEIPK